MQGLYRVRLGSQEVLETFVAAPGPMGWRYVGRAHEPDTGREVFRVDHVVDATWNLVRFRWSDAEGAEVVAAPASGNVEVWIGEHRELVAATAAVWSPSPSSLLVLDRLLRTSGVPEVAAVHLAPPFAPRRILVGVTAGGSRSATTGGDTAEAREVAVVADGRRTRALLRSDLPLRADGWFELIG